MYVCHICCKKVNFFIALGKLPENWLSPKFLATERTIRQTGDHCCGSYSTASPVSELNPLERVPESLSKLQQTAAEENHRIGALALPE